MKSVAIVLLTHKMTATFDSSEDVERVDPETICQSVISIGFGCSLLRISESERSPSTISSINTLNDSPNNSPLTLLDNEQQWKSFFTDLNTSNTSESESDCANLRRVTNFYDDNDFYNHQHRNYLNTVEMTKISPTK